MKAKSRLQSARRALIFWTLFIGVGAVAGAVCMLLDPSGRRMGYVKKVAYAEAARTGACLYEIRATERTAGTAGFWWCGRFAMHRWDMPIAPVGIDLSEYGHVTVCYPIWVFSLAPPVRSFCRAAAGKIKEADYISVHHTARRYENAVREMDALLQLRHTGYRSISCKMGVFSEAEKVETA